MGSVNLVVVVESIRSIAAKEGDSLQKFHIPSIIAVAVALGVKFLLFLYCLSIRSKSSQVRVLWEDHRNDLYINGFGVIVAWGRTIYLEFELLAGKSAPHDFLQLIIYKSATFSEDIIKVDTVRAYHVRTHQVWRELWC
ncbi:hypothetical protein DXG03_008332 [Asterophora parasitica]|uniref:Uncharacterized protein n=1 Tax=Asterophora parasitica TaxID=117018 RepID=A0A9P7G497_9AGAR|nr:hypothetical protein DXG03_008332 [Asterophora parasitica]